MDISKTIAELKQRPGFLERVGMVLTHNGVARATSRSGAPVERLSVTPDYPLIEAIRQEGLGLPGVFEIVIEARQGIFRPGDDLLFIVVAGDIRENVLSALTKTLTRVKAEAMAKREFPA